ncbi:hypothetical protein NERG_00710 [Nematocida ausubeli]|uniref:Insulysin n=1 Tax=Nematocida ausubeli (strain ATCC PRA-371 / ERTm2) TaxID=1913371 RepID=H8ZAW1_NEMA1|nr:hypothetical protein NERG_00710 [Nematocida ausubeli]
MLTGKGDTYTYKTVTLPNGIRTLLSHNPTADKAAVAVSIKVGSYSDPRSLPGLAHFLEHMLFMGTEEHPDENAYMEYIHMHNGNSNANTADEVTNYFYDIDPAYLKESMKIFSRFFTSPLIREDALARELQAVNSEHSVNILAETWRRYHLLTLVSKADSPGSKFGTGSSETLSTATRDDLLCFWKYFYRPDRMCLSIHGRESLEELEEWAIEMFSDIKGHEIEYIWDDIPYIPPVCQKYTPGEYCRFNESSQNKLVLYRPAVHLNTDHSSMSICIPLPESITGYRRKTHEFLVELIAGTGKSGLVCTLLKEGIAIDVSAYLEENSFSSTLHIVIDLVDDNKAQTFIIQELLKYYLEMIKISVSSDLYGAFKTISKKAFDAGESIEPLELVEISARNMQFYPTEEFIKYSHIWDGLNLEEFNSVVEVALDVSKWVVMYCARNIHSPENILVDEIYGINYMIDEMPSGDISLLGQLKEKIEWSFFVPSDKDVAAAREEGVSVVLGSIPTNIPEYPEESISVSCMEISQPGCTGYLVHNPKYRNNAQIRMVLETDSYLLDEKTHAAAVGYFQAFVQMFSEKYRLDLMASVLTLVTVESAVGFSIRFSGSPVVIEDLIEKFFSEYTARDTQLFSLAKESAISYFLKQVRNSPYKCSIQGINYLAGYPMFDAHKLMQVSKDLLPDDLFAVNRAQVKVLGVGNVTKKEFEQIITRIGKYVTFTPYTPAWSAVQKDITLPTVDLHNIAVTAVHRVCADSLLKAVALGTLISQIFSERFFDELRTKEEYGYIVFMSHKVFMQKVYVQFTVQSTRSLDNVTNRIREFVLAMEKRVSEMPSEEFLAHKNSAILAVKEETINLEDYATEIFHYWLCMGFNLEKKNEIAAEIEKISKENILEYSKSMSHLMIIQATKP